MTQAEAARYARLVIAALEKGEGVRNEAALREALDVLAGVVERKNKA